MLTEQHPRLDEVNRASLAVIADGHPSVWRSALKSRSDSGGSLPCRVAGSDLIVELARQATQFGHRIFLLGAAEGVAAKAAAEL